MQAIGGGNGYTEAQVIDALKARVGSREMSFRYELLDSTDTFRQDLTNVLAGWVSLNNFADIKRTARFTFEDTGEINFLSDRVKPWARLRMPVSLYTYATVLGTSLIRWAMDDTSGTSVPDSSGNSHNGTLAGTGVSKNRPGLLDKGSAYNFTLSGTGSNAQLTGASFLNGLEELTVVAWVRSNAVNTTSNIVTAGTGANVLNLSYAATGAAGGQLSVIQATVATDHGNVTVCTAAGTQSLQTQCIVMTWKAGVGITLYVNGAEAALSGSSGQATVGVTTGADTYVTGKLWSGTLDDVSVLPVAVGSAQALAIYQSGAAKGPYGADNWVEWPLGVFLLSSPSRDIDGQDTITRDVEAYDKLLIYSDDAVTDRYSLAAGTNVTDTVRTLLGTTTAKSVVNSALTTPAAMEWEPGTSKLTIINALLSSINYRSLSFREDGTAVVQPYQSPADRTPEFEYADDEQSVSLPEMEQTLDLFGVPNKWVRVVSDPDRPALTSTFTNDDPTSFTSTVSRGRTIVDFQTEQNAVDQTSLDGITQRAAFEASQVYEEIAFETALMPVHSNDDVYTLTFTRLAVADKYSGHTWELPLKAGETMKHTARRIVQV